MLVNENLVQDIVQEVIAKMQIAEPVGKMHGIFTDMNDAIAAAKAAGRCWGNPGIERPAEADDYAILWREKKISLEEIGRRLGVSRSTAYRFVKSDKNHGEKFGENDD